MNRLILQKTLITATLILSLSQAHAAGLAQGSFSTVSGEATNLSEIAAQADRNSQSAQRFFTQLGFSLSASTTVTVKAYASNQDMLQNTPANAAKDVSMLGYFNHSTGEIGVQSGLNSDELSRILSHEIIHKFFHESLKSTPPAWLDEGMAEFLSRDPYALEAFHAGSMSMLQKTVLELAAAKNEVSLQNLFTLNHDTFYGAKQDVNYATSYAFIAYLLNTQGPRVLGNFLKDVAAGENPTTWMQTKLGVTSVSDYQKSMLDWALKS